MKIQNTIISLSLLLPALLLGTTSPIDTKEDTKILATVYTLNGNIETAYNTLIEKKLPSIGFRQSNSYKRLNDQYKAKFGSTILDLFSSTPLIKESDILPLLKSDPRLAAFTPFNLLIYKKLDENMTHVGHLTPQVMLDILDIDNDEVKRKFTNTFKGLDATIRQELGVSASMIQYDTLPKKAMIQYEYTFNNTQDIDTFMNQFKDNFLKKGYDVSEYHDFLGTSPHAKEILSEYTTFGTYALKNMDFSYTLFDNVGAVPQAALFTPSTIYMYAKKETNKLIVGMQRLHNLSTTLNITDKKRLDAIDKLDNEIVEILKSLGLKSVDISTASPTNNAPDIQAKPNANNTMTESTIATPKHPSDVQTITMGDHTIVEIKIPKVPSVPTVVGSDKNTLNRGIKFSKRVPPNYVAHRFDNAQQTTDTSKAKVGEVNKGKIAAYLRGDYIEVDTLKEELEKAGFKIITTVPLNKKKTLISIVFTNDDLLSIASKENRGFMGSLRALVDTKENSISITNPLYMAKGFLQDDFDEKVAKKVLTQLVDAFPKLNNSKDALKYQLLPKYQFMNGMPKYHDMIEVATGDDLVEKAKNNKNVVFMQTLSNGATLIGIQLAKRTAKFTKKIGTNNAAMLPYPILIENGKARILDPKYYISFMYPMLTMSEFMTIATVPDAMLKDCEKIFK